MSDFETHPIGTAEEIRLSREMYHVIDQMMEQWGDTIVSPTIKKAHDALLECYMRQLKREIQ